jgi:phage gp46-like protein
MDLLINETGNGGDIVKNGNDLALVFSFENMIYLAMFGGNKEAVTRPRLATEQATDYFANSLLFPNDSSIQFNSLTEKALDETPLTSSGRLLIENEIKKDLQFMQAFAEVTVKTSIPATDTIIINVKVKEPDNLQEREFIYIWQQGKISFNGENIDSNGLTIEEFYLDNELDYLL